MCRSLLVLAIALLPALALAGPETSERDTWRADIAAARERADVLRRQLKEDLERRKLERRLNPPVEKEFDKARRASEEVRNDLSLQYGDVISTTEGLFVFVGKPGSEHGPEDFVPFEGAHPTR